MEKPLDPSFYLTCATCRLDVTGLVVDKDGRYACVQHQHASETLCAWPRCGEDRSADAYCDTHRADANFAAAVAPIVALAEDANPVVGWQPSPLSDLTLKAVHKDGSVGPETLHRVGAPGPSTPDEEDGGTAYVPRLRRRAAPRDATTAPAETDARRALEDFDLVAFFGQETLELLAAALRSTAKRRVERPTIAQCERAHALVNELHPFLREALRLAAGQPATIFAALRSAGFEPVD